MGKDDPALSTESLEVYFKNLAAVRNNTHVKITLVSDKDGHTSFEVSLQSKDIEFTGAFPQRHLSLEKHRDFGHEGVHLQIHYHLIDNSAEIGKLYIHLDIEDSKHLQDIAEGFIYALYELLKELGGDYAVIVDDIFFPELVAELEPKRTVLRDAIETCYRSRGIEVRLYRTNKATMITGEELMELTRTRKELVPLIGTLTEKSQ